MKQIFYTHIKQALTNERMKLNIITKVKEVRRKTGSALYQYMYIKTRAHKNSVIKHSGLWLYDVDNDRCVLAPYWVSYFINFSQFFCQTFPFLDLKGVK